MLSLVLILILWEWLTFKPFTQISHNLMYDLQWGSGKLPSKCFPNDLPVCKSVRCAFQEDSPKRDIWNADLEESLFSLTGDESHWTDSFTHLMCWTLCFTLVWFTYKSPKRIETLTLMTYLSSGTMFSPKTYIKRCGKRPSKGRKSLLGYVVGLYIQVHKEHWDS